MTISVELDPNKSYAHILVLLEDQTTDAMLTWYQGPFNHERVSELVDELRSEQDFYYGEMIEAGFQEGDSVELLVELVWVEPERQYGSGEGEVHTLPGYYDIRPLEVLMSSIPYSIGTTE